MRERLDRKSKQKAKVQPGMTRWRHTAGHYHGLLHGDDLLTVDLPQSAGVAFQSGLQATSGLKHTQAGENSFIKAIKSGSARKLQNKSCQ